jgi:ADP-ribose pyrophosphatase YjhB (NUDIX family)
MEENITRIAVRLIIIKSNKLLVVSNDRDGFLYFPGGKTEFRESVIDAASREVREEMGEDVEFNFKKLLYVVDFISQKNLKHKLELFILGDINKFEELEGKTDPEHDGNDHFTWVDISKLPSGLKPEKIVEVIAKDYLSNFSNIESNYFITE